MHSSLGSQTAQPPDAPVAPRVPAVRTLHGEAVADDYAWMRDPADPALRGYLAAERAYYDAQGQHLAELTGTLAAEAASRIPDAPEDSVSWPLRGFSYRTRMPQESENLQFLRSQSGKSPEQLLLDDNLVARPTGFADVAVRQPSPDGEFLAWSADSSGAEIYELRIRDLRTGRDLPDLISRSYPGVAWCTASRYLLYVVPDGLNRPHQVWRHQVGTPADRDAVVFEEADPRFEGTLHASRSGKLAIITSASRDTTEVRVVPLDSPLADPVLLRPRQRGAEYRADHASAGRPDGQPGGTVYLVTDGGQPEFTLMRAPAAAPALAAWTPVSCAAIAPARGDTRLVSCDVLAGHLVLTLRRNGGPLLAITDHDGGNVREITPGLAAGSIRVAHAEDYDRASVIIAEESLIEPPAWYELDLSTAGRKLLKRMEVPGYSPARYRDRAQGSAGCRRHPDPGHARVPGGHRPGRHRAVPGGRAIIRLSDRDYVAHPAAAISGSYRGLAIDATMPAP